MITDQNKKLIEQMFNEVMNGKDLSKVSKYIAPDFIHRGIPNAKGGPEGFTEVLQQFFSAFPDMRINVEHLLGDGDMVATRGHWTGTNKGSFMGMPATGKQVRVEFIDVWKLKDGMCVANWVQMDNAGMMQQLGLAPAMA